MASGARRKAMYVLGGLGLVLVLAVGGVYGFSSRDFNETYDVEPAPLVLGDSWSPESAVERGRHLAFIRGCADCHAEDGGGDELVDDPAFGVLWASNLTSGEGGIGGTYTDRDWDRAVRHGVGPSGQPLMFMPAHEFWPLSDEDLAALIAYYRSVPAVDRVRPETKPGPLARVLYLTGQLPLVPAKLVDHERARPQAPAEAPTAAYGEYLATGCTGCHGVGLSGGKITGGDPNWPPAKNITPDPETGIGDWSQADFVRAMREGVRPNGSEINPAMPVSATRHMTDVELEALYRYLMSVEPKPFGNK